MARPLMLLSHGRTDFVQDGSQPAQIKGVQGESIAPAFRVFKTGFCAIYNGGGRPANPAGQGCGGMAAVVMEQKSGF